MDRHTSTDVAFKQLVDLWVLVMERDAVADLARELRRITADGLLRWFRAVVE